MEIDIAKSSDTLNNLFYVLIPLIGGIIIKAAQGFLTYLKTIDEIKNAGEAAARAGEDTVRGRLNDCEERRGKLLAQMEEALEDAIEARAKLGLYEKYIEELKILLKNCIG